MNPSATSSSVSSRNRQIAYAVTALVLFTAMYPYTEWLNSVKAKRELGEATIGQIDTGSFMLKLALLGGARGVAANVLWNRAIDLQKSHEWDRLDQTVNLITKLQPHFLSVWTFQSWNLAYNVSVEWDDPADKYEWIKRGINFVRDGVEKNRRSPDLLWDTAWTYYHKYGFADESVILRRFFYDDDDEDFKLDPVRFNDEGIRATFNDSFQVSRGWFSRSVRLVDEGGWRLASGVRAEEVAPATDIEYVDRPMQRKGRVGDLTFRTMPAHAQTRFAIAQEKMSIKGVEPKFGDAARGAWDDALQEWVTFGTYVFPAFNAEGINVQLDDATDPARFEALHPTAKYWTERWANDTNYRYWKARCQAEADSAGVNARRYFYEATRALKTANFEEAADKYLRGLQLWKSVLEDFPAYNSDSLLREDVGFLVKRYALALRQLGTPEVPADTPFYDLYQEVKDTQIPTDPHDALEVLGRDVISKAN